MSALDAGPDLAFFGLLLAAALAAGVIVAAKRGLAALGLFHHVVTHEADRAPDREPCR